MWLPETINRKKITAQMYTITSVQGLHISPTTLRLLIVYATNKIP